MGRVFVQTSTIASNIEGKHMVADDGYLYVYADDDGYDLRGVYRISEIIVAYKTEDHKNK